MAAAELWLDAEGVAAPPPLPPQAVKLVMTPTNISCLIKGGRIKVSSLNVINSEDSVKQNFEYVIDINDFLQICGVTHTATGNG